MKPASRSPFLYSSTILKTIRNNFVKELVNAIVGKKSSLSFLKNPLLSSPLISEGEIFQVMVIGGRRFETAKIRLERQKRLTNLALLYNGRIILTQGRKLNILSHRRQTLPFFTTAQKFFEFFEKEVESNIKVIALNFAFPLVPSLRGRVLDGSLIKGTKEHQFCGLTGKKIGQELEKYILKKRRRKIKVAVANDTICLLLAGTDLGQFQRRLSQRWFQTIAGILGTGTNFAFFLNDDMPVNLESGNFDKFPQTETGKIIDKNSINPGSHPFEKEVAGAYLYQHYNLLITQLPMLSIQRSSKDIRIHSSLELSKRAQKGDFLAQKLLERSASLIACQMAGVSLFKKSQISSTKPQTNSKYKILNFVMEGSLFWQGCHYQNYVRKYLKLLDVSSDEICFIKIKNSAIIGAAKLIS